MIYNTILLSARGAAWLADPMHDDGGEVAL